MLGTDRGLLLNELLRSPAATLEPLHDIFKYILKIRECSVHSVNANFILFILQVRQQPPYLRRVLGKSKIRILTQSYQMALSTLLIPTRR